MKKSIIIGVTGASGALYARLLLDRLNTLHECISTVGVVFSTQAVAVWEHEIGPFRKEDIPFPVYAPDDLFAPMASGSAGYDAMIIIPCSMGTLGRLSAGTANDLMTRAADVILKEGKQLILVPREAPMNLIHLRNMVALAEAGAVICPASPSFYSHPASVEETAMTVVNRVLVLAGFPFQGYRWGEE